MHESIFKQRGPTATLQPVRSDLTGLHRVGGWEGNTRTLAVRPAAEASANPRSKSCANRKRTTASRALWTSFQKTARLPTKKKEKRARPIPLAGQKTQVLNVGRPAVLYRIHRPAFSSRDGRCASRPSIRHRA